MNQEHYNTRPKNLAAHDLTNLHKPPPNYQSLLGLGLSFIPRPKWTTYRISETLNRFKKDLYTRVEHCALIKKDNNDEYDPKLHKKSTRTISDKRMPTEILTRFKTFSREIKKLYRKRQAAPNLTASQLQCLETLRTSQDIMVCSTDKNLGPAIIDRVRYAKLAHADHLSTANYQELDEGRAKAKLHRAYEEFQGWMDTYGPSLDKKDRKFLLDTTKVLNDKEEYTFPQFYITAKVHKKELCTRPIVSCSGSLFESFGRWIDRRLQPIGRATRSFIQSSTDLLNKLKKIPDLPPTARLFTCDARSMYTNIHTEHCAAELRRLRMVPEHLLLGLEIIMDNRRSSIQQVSKVLQTIYRRRIRNLGLDGNAGVRRGLGGIPGRHGCIR